MTHRSHAPGAGLDGFFAPRSIAVIGASDDPERIGGRPLHFCLNSGFSGPIYPVNPRREVIQGLPAFADLEAIPGPVDLAILAISADRIPETLRACGRKGVRAAVIFSAGFAELGPDGQAAQAELVQIAHAQGIRLLGPNCLGFYSAGSGACGTFSSALQGGLPARGGIGLITQSGAYGTHLLSMAKERRLGIAAWVSTGNEADVSVADCLAHMVEDPEVRAIGVYMEGVNQPEALLAALERARVLRKPVTIMKVGVSEVGAQAMQSHTASLAGSDASFEAAVEQAGALRIATTEEMFDILYAASIAPLPRGDRLGILTVSGGAGVLMADAAAKHGLSVPPMPDDAVARMLERNPFASPRNPVDITAQAINDFDLIPDYLSEMMQSGGYDACVGFFTSWAGAARLGPLIHDALIRGLAGFDRPFVLVGLLGDELAAQYDAAGIPCFADPSRAVAVLGALARLRAGFDRPATAGALPVIDDPVLPATPLSEAAAKARLVRAGIPCLPEKVAQTADEAASIATAMGLPVAMKILSPDIAHKTDIGGVALNLADAETVREAAARMLRDIPARLPEARIEGVLITPMAGEGVELILGTQRDPVIGPMVMVGMGGILAEVAPDVVLARAPVTPQQALGMLDRLRAAALLDGVRGRAGVDRGAIADAIARLSVLAVANADTIDSIEINPLLARPDGALALDALIVPRGQARRKDSA
ncbi:acetate--CoA ligase family protein [Rhodalgimonas zhirmunskyi]|uniref:Acetate--CoA ligase family protein n=1 Tax=Rhodalgimonas zhirmunskyi TaxID=2964767 RepID=A0AAJ1UAX9_9RHOB|nr:acetate--CoA ligase family protein [Rhodoalgimonas zhirmunskyi]MDQ2095145.1 acetate--CoA ligase family protein [Rhodoalgimonas zhirmunskyi]